MRSLSSCRVFNHTASCQNGSRTSIIGLKINMILKDIIFITRKLWLVGWNEQCWRFERRCLHLMLPQLFIWYAIYAQGYLLQGKKSGMSHEADADYVCDSSWQIGKDRKMKVLTLPLTAMSLFLSFAISVSNMKRNKIMKDRNKERGNERIRHAWERTLDSLYSVYWHFTGFSINSL